MTLDDFLALDTPDGDQNAARLDYVAQVIIGQNPRLRRGDDMTGPVAAIRKGKQYSGSLATPDEGPQPKTISARAISVPPEQLFDFHPWLDVLAGDFLHMYQVEIVNGFGDRKVGDRVRVKFDPNEFEGGAYVYIPLTQDMIDQTTRIVIRFGIS